MATKPIKPEVPDVAQVQMRALEPIRANGVDYAPGDVLDMAQADADALLAGGWGELFP
jgi:hypothetical protein